LSSANYSNAFQVRKVNILVLPTCSQIFNFSNY